jgi:hypothetical protein
MIRSLPDGSQGCVGAFVWSHERVGRRAALGDLIAVNGVHDNHHRRRTTPPPAASRVVSSTVMNLEVASAVHWVTARAEPASALRAMSRAIMVDEEGIQSLPPVRGGTKECMDGSPQFASGRGDHRHAREETLSVCQGRRS